MSTDTLRRMSRGSSLLQTGWSLPMTGIPWEVPVPKNVMVILSSMNSKIITYLCKCWPEDCNFVPEKLSDMPTVPSKENAFENIPSIKAKTLRINLNPNIYGTFAEIGAGQETARHFFRAGGASGTIAKAMSAYDKSFSDAIYGIEEDGRYVTQSRLKKMLDHEMKLVEERISRENNPNYLFFTYANTVATIDFSKRYKGHGWVGIRFQLDPDQNEYDESVLHIRVKQNEARLQQETLGILGVNLIYGAFFKFHKPKKLLKYLYDHIDKDTLEIDMVNFTGPNFAEV